MRGSKRNKKKSYYKKRHQMSLNRPDENIFFPGFLITCNERREREAVKEFYQLMDRKIESIYGELNPDEEAMIDKQVQIKLQKRDHFEKPKAEDSQLKKVKVSDDSAELKDTKIEKNYIKEKNETNKEKIEAVEDNGEINKEKSEKTKENENIDQEKIKEEAVVINAIEQEKTENKNLNTIEEKKDFKPERFMRKFKQIKINKKGILFFRLNEVYEDKINLMKISDSIVQDFKDGLTAKYVKIFKIIPIEVCCFASFDNFEHYSKLFFSNYLNNVEEGQSLSVFFKCRNNSKFTKSEILEWVRGNKPEKLKFLEYKADYTLFVDIVQVKYKNS